MKLRTLATTLGCLLALGGCITVSEPLADTDASLGDFVPGHPSSPTENGAGAGGSVSPDGTGGVPGFASPDGVGGGGAGQGGGGADGVGGAPAPDELPCRDGSSPCAWPGPDAGIGSSCEDGTSNPCASEGSASPDGSSPSPARWLGTESHGCTRIEDTALCMGEGWMLADAEAIPDCGQSGAYRICTLENNTCVTHVVMMVQRCD